MRSFNSFISIAILSTLVAACDSKRNPYFGSEEAEFKVDEISVVSTQAMSQNSFGAVNKVRYDLKVCIQDLAGNALPPNLKFDIIVGKEGLTRTTNINGCVGWQREVGFDPLAEEKYYILTTTIVGRNEIRGTLNVDVALNPWKKELKDLHQNRDALPPAAQSERISAQADGFVIPDITSQGTAAGTGSSNSSPNTGGASNSSTLPRTNVIQTESLDSGRYPVQMAIKSVTLKKQRLSPEKPYTIDEFLNLTTHEVHEFGADVLFFRKSFENADESLTPLKGKFKITMALLEEPNYEINDIWKVLDSARTAQDILQIQNNTIVVTDVKRAVLDMIAMKRLQMGSTLDLDTKRRLVARTVMPYLLQTHQFESELSARTGFTSTVNLSFTNLAKLKDRAWLAYTFQPLSPDLRIPLKADGVAHATAGLHGGWGLLHPLRMEADIIFAESKLSESKVRKASPFVSYLSDLKLIKRNNKPLDVRVRTDIGKIPESEIITGQGDYDFVGSLKKFVDGKLTATEQKKFIWSLCHKTFAGPALEAIEKKKDSKEERMNLAFHCERAPNSWFTYSKFEFVEKPAVEVNKVGVTENKSITATRSFTKANEIGTSIGSANQLKLSLSGTAGIEAGWATSMLNLPKDSPFTAGGNLGLGLTMSMGQEWYRASTRSSSQTQSSSVSTANEFKINIEHTTYQFVADMKQCVQVNLTNHTKVHMQKYYPSAPELPDGYIFCSPTEKLSRYEDYYIINQACSAENKTTDCSAPDENRFRMVIRGQNVYKLFENIVKNSGVNIMLQPISHDVVRHEILSWEKQFDDFLTSQFLPGVIPRD